MLTTQSSLRELVNSHRLVLKLSHMIYSPLAPETLAYSTHEAIEGRKILVKQLRRDGRKKLLEQTWLLQMENRDEADEMTVADGGQLRGKLLLH